MPWTKQASWSNCDNEVVSRKVQCRRGGIPGICTQFKIGSAQPPCTSSNMNFWKTLSQNGMNTKWGAWGAWSACESGQRTIKRPCGGGECIETEPCYRPNQNPNKWNLWASWSDAKLPARRPVHWAAWSQCVYGQRTRNKPCVSPDCVETEACDSPTHNAKKWSRWSSWHEEKRLTSSPGRWAVWSACNNGQRIRRRQCGPTQANDCVETQACERRTINPNNYSRWSSWSDAKIPTKRREQWSTWSACTYGQRARTKPCGARDCVDTQACYRPIRNTVNWSVWSSWSEKKHLIKRPCMIGQRMGNELC